MKKFAIIASVFGALGVLFGAFGAHAVKGKISDYHYSSYRVGIEYLFFHLVPLFYIASQSENSVLSRIGFMFTIGIVFFAGSNLLMTTEALHHINFHFLWPVTPLGGVLMLSAWLMLTYHLIKNKD